MTVRIKTAEQVAPSELSHPDIEGVTFRMLIGPDDGAPHFHMRRFDLQPAGHTPRHAHDWEHEVYVLGGRGIVCTPNGERPIQAGQCVFVPAGDEHQFQNTGPETLAFLCLVPAGAG